MQDNGSDPFAGAIADLRAFLAKQADEEDRLRAQLIALQDSTRRARRAIEVLSDRKINEAHKRKTYPWTPRPENIERVMGALANGAQTVSEIAEATSLNTETTRRVVQLLREQERVRLSGTKQAGRSTQKAKTFALMPEPNSAA